MIMNECTLVVVVISYDQVGYASARSYIDDSTSLCILFMPLNQRCQKLQIGTIIS